MAAPTRTPRTSWVEEGLRALGVGGPDAVRIEKLAETLGVTKGGFYWHFDGRSALLEEMLDAWERLVIDEVIERVEAGGGDGKAKLRRLSALAGSARDAHEIAAGDVAACDPTEVGIIGEIEELGPELHFDAFLYGELPCDIQVGVPQAWISEDIAAARPNPAVARPRLRCGGPRPG